MIVPIPMFGVICDSCGKAWIDEDLCICAHVDESSMSTVINEDSDWQTDGDKHYCRDCWYWDENDELKFGKK